MIIKPRVRGFMCITTHPTGCAANVQRQADYVIANGEINGGEGPKNVLVIGASTGYGLASRITAAFGCRAATLGIFFEKEGTERKPASAGWYNSAAFHDLAEAEGLYAKSINGDAFSDEIKAKTIETIKADLGQIDLVVYSLASPRRTDPKTGEVYTSTLKPIGNEITIRGINTDKKLVEEVSVPAATEEEIAGTVKVMGGEDWQLWIEALNKAGVLAEGAKTTAYTYLGAEPTWDIYWNGTIGAAKRDLDAKAKSISDILAPLNGDAKVSVLKAVVTQASSAIPVMPLYLSMLFKIMKAEGTHEGCIEQIDLIFRESLYGDTPRIDEDGRLRADYKELAPHVQQQVSDLWKQVGSDNIDELTDFKGYQTEFLQLFGFEMAGVDYEADVEQEVPIANMV
ncbi:MAG: trans-2-enoyl-CoA reductase family protein [Gammaproteobacteria bacterium]|jgi:enoyl-[acyl-carrier protein] reductase / trans-2-enoyl-CoA reductase (NAD+)|nr:trans-2-enoyl-CoA reductase family protein [Gammaproteobacteria bacterium]